MIRIYWMWKKCYQLKKCKNKDGGRVGKEKKCKESGTAVFTHLLAPEQTLCFLPMGTKCLPRRCVVLTLLRSAALRVVPTKPPSFALALLISLLLTIIKSLSKVCVCRSPISNHFSHSDLHPKVPSTSMLLT